MKLIIVADQAAAYYYFYGTGEVKAYSFTLMSLTCRSLCLEQMIMEGAQTPLVTFEAGLIEVIIL